MACSDKSYEVISKNDWLRKLENVHIQRTDMNKLIMNYLVTGTVYYPVVRKFIHHLFINTTDPDSVLSARRIQRGC